MTRVIEAVFTRGLLKPVEQLSLREDQRVRLIVQTLDEPVADRAAVLARLREGIERMSFYLEGKLPKRDELHDRS